MISWNLMQTPETKAAADLAAWRSQAWLPKLEFALAAMHAGLITAQEAEGWAAAQAFPAVVLTALATLPAAEQAEARIRMIASANVRRDSPFIALMAAHLGMSEAQVDALFGGPPNVAV